MNSAGGLALIGLLLVGPVVSRAIEERIEIFFLVIGLLAMTLAGAWRWEVAGRAAQVPLGITLTVIVADIAFGRVRSAMDRALGWIQARVSRPWLCGGAVFAIALLSAMLTAIVSALMLAELVELMRLGPLARTRVTVAGCFAIGMGSSLTPLGGPLSTLAASGLGMRFGGLFAMLAPYVLPGMLACAIVAGQFATEDEGASASEARLALLLIRESVARAYPRTRGLRFHRGLGAGRRSLCAAGGALCTDARSVDALLVQHDFGGDGQRDAGRAGDSYGGPGASARRDNRPPGRGRHAHPGQHPQHRCRLRVADRRW
jgi:hypothetical protein